MRAGLTMFANNTRLPPRFQLECHELPCRNTINTAAAPKRRLKGCIFPRFKAVCQVHIGPGFELKPRPGEFRRQAPPAVDAKPIRRSVSQHRCAASIYRVKPLL